jgi:uncharacterized protein (TIGR02118 family)
MHKLVILIHRSPQAETLERRWSDGFVPAAERLPGLRRVVVTRPVGAPASAPRFQLIHELFFDDLDSLQAAMTSPDGQAAGRALMEFASAEAELFFAEHLEMALESRPAGPGAPV